MIVILLIGADVQLIQRPLSCWSSGMGIVRFALRFPYTFYALAALILFLGILAIVVMPVDIFIFPEQ
jgi:hypothetical protein